MSPRRGEMANQPPHSDELIAGLTQRIYQLEEEVAELRRLQGLPPRPLPKVTRAKARHEAPRLAPVPAEAPTLVRPQPTTAAKLTNEANVIGTWFARVGVVAILFGAAFAFKYGIDRGVLGPTARVVIGLFAGFAFLAWGEVVHRRAWHLFAQAVSAGGIALLYLSILSALHLYDLTTPPVAFVGLLAVTGIGAALAMRSDSLALAILATVGGFLNPFLVGVRELDPFAFLSYVVALDVLVLLLAPRRWAVLDRVALAGTILVTLAITPEETVSQRIAFATVLFAIFVVSMVIRAVRRTDDATPTTAPDVILGVGAFYYLYMLATLSESHAGWRGLFTASLAALFGGGAYAALRRGLREEAVSALIGAAILSAAFVPIQLSTDQLAAGWAVEALGLFVLGSRADGDRRVRGGAHLLWLVATVAQVAVLMDRYPTPSLVVTWTAFFAIVTAGLLGVGSWLASREHVEHERGDVPPETWAIAASIVGLTWMSTELAAEVSRNVTDPTQPVQFGLTALWTVYAAALFAGGMVARARWARLSGAVLFAITIGKIVVSDLWLLRTSYRIVAFMGLGAVLLACSLMYQRFRDVLLAEDEPAEPVPPPEPPAGPSRKTRAR